MRKLVNSIGGQGHTLTRWTVRKTEFPSEQKMVEKAKADRRKATGNHNWSDRAIPNLKGCRLLPGGSGDEVAE